MICRITQTVLIIATLSAFLSSSNAFAPIALHQYFHILFEARSKKIIVQASTFRAAARLSFISHTNTNFYTTHGCIAVTSMTTCLTVSFFFYHLSLSYVFSPATICILVSTLALTKVCTCLVSITRTLLSAGM